jgi:hypothetical protein
LLGNSSGTYSLHALSSSQIDVAGLHASRIEGIADLYAESVIQDEDEEQQELDILVRSNKKQQVLLDCARYQYVN